MRRASVAVILAVSVAVLSVVALLP